MHDIILKQYTLKLYCVREAEETEVNYESYKVRTLIYPNICVLINVS